MKKVKHILATFLHSVIPSDIYYPKLLHTRFQYSLKYYFIVLSFFAFVLTGLVFCQWSPLEMINYKHAIIDSLATFPEGVRVTVKNGVLDSDQNKPLFLWVYRHEQPLFVVMVDAKNATPNSQVPLPLIFLNNTKAQISYRGNIYVQPYSPTFNMTITKGHISSLITHINSFFPPFIIFFYLFLFVIVPLTFMMTFTSFLLVSSVLVFLLLRTFIPHIHIKKGLQAGMHGTHIPLFIMVLLFVLFPSSPNILIIGASLIFIFSLVSTYEMYSKEITHFRGL